MIENLKSRQTLNAHLANRWQHCRWIAAIICLLICQSATLLQGQTASQQEYIRGLYRAYYERNPSVAETGEWVSWFRRGSSAEEVHASFISSDEFFNRMNRNSDRWLNSVFQIVVGRQPTAQELNYWKQRYLALRQDRRAFGLEFLKSMGNRRPGSGSIGSSSSMDSLARQLSSQVRNLRNAVNQELPGNTAVLRMQVNSLVTAATRIRTTASKSNSDQREIRQAVYDCRSAYIGVQSGLRGQYGAFKSQLYLNQIGETLQLLTEEVGLGGEVSPGRPPGYYPPGVIPGVPNPDRPGNDWRPQESRTLTRLTRSLTSEVNSLYYLLQNLARNDYRYQSLVADMQWYATQVSDFSNEITSNTGRRRIDQMLRRLESKSEEFNQRVNGQAVDVRLRQGLFQVDQNLAQIRTIVGGANQLPAVPPSKPVVPDYRQLLVEIDRAIAECERLIAIYSNYVIYGRPVQVYLTNMRAARQQLLFLRASVVSNKNRELMRQDVNATVNIISNLKQPWLSVSQTVRSADGNDMSGLNSAVSRIQALAN